MFSDGVSIQNAPAKGAFLRISISLSGAISNVTKASTNVQLDMSDARNRAECNVANSPTGSCRASLAVTSPSQSFSFSVNLGSDVVASLDYVGKGADTEYANLTGKVTRLAVVNSKGKTISGVVITTTSGHRYPL